MTTLYGPSMGPAAGGSPRTIVVLLHGVGADGQDLVDLASVLAPFLPHALFVAPDAPEPCDMAAFGRQWFSLQDRQPAALLAGIRRTAPLLDAHLDELLARHGLDESRLALLGFSQGAMMALHVAPRRTRPVAAVLGLSGALIGAEDLAREVRSRPPVMLIHGDADDVVPFEAMFAAVAGLQAAGIPVQWIRRPGLAHGIDPEGIAAGGRFLQAMLPPV
ncbi:alpha/beta hydrolase [Benzoatithermus flavus]|uniref:Prolyl oligopeptidase family serine peptidase n=1 Tax=Benzoatithermus flavus TaxID=3108223 RepID=A0ABU8XXP2_9PROT